jgi:hypothetical protein
MDSSSPRPPAGPPFPCRESIVMAWKSLRSMECKLQRGKREKSPRRSGEALSGCHPQSPRAE